MNHDPMIAIDDLSMRYSVADGEVTVLDTLSLEVPRGERVAIVGPSGSGKTTLLLLLTGLERADEGRVRIDGEALHELDDDARADLRRERIGIVFQSFHLIPSLTAAENVALPLDIAGRRDGRERARAMLERVGLGSRLSHYPSQLSGGEQQRVAIARALVHEPRLLVADEPTGNLDERSGERIVELLFALNRESGATLVLVTHDPSLAARCDRTLHLHEGKLHESAVVDGASAAGAPDGAAEPDESRRAGPSRSAGTTTAPDGPDGAAASYGRDGAAPSHGPDDAAASNGPAGTAS